MSAPEAANGSDWCEMVLLVQAEFDGELDAAQAAALETHRGQCRICQAAVQKLVRTRDLMRGQLYEPMPDAVRRRVLARLDAARPASIQPPFWSRLRAWRRSALGFGLGAACAAALSFLILSPSQQSLTDQVIAGHIRALQPGHLEDVASSNRHTVKPWFDGRIDFAPPVKDFAALGFPLRGGRLDYLGGRPVAALVYQRDKHIINLFVWPVAHGTNTAPVLAEHQGYNVVHWTQNGMTFWAVSDVESNQLLDFAKDWKHSS